MVAAGCEDDQIDYTLDIKTNADGQDIWISEVSGRPIGVIFCIDPAKEASQYWGLIEPGTRALDIWIGAATDLGRGYGTQMMQQVLEICFSDPDIHTVIIDPLRSNKNAIRFYKRLGFTFVENRIFGADECAVYHLKRGNWANR